MMPFGRPVVPDVRVTLAQARQSNGGDATARAGCAMIVFQHHHVEPERGDAMHLGALGDDVAHAR